MKTSARSCALSGARVIGSFCVALVPGPPCMPGSGWWSFPRCPCSRPFNDPCACPFPVITQYAFGSLSGHPSWDATVCHVLSTQSALVHWGLGHPCMLLCLRSSYLIQVVAVRPKMPSIATPSHPICLSPSAPLGGWVGLCLLRPHLSDFAGDSEAYP